MRETSLTLRSWPGLARLWCQGDLRSLLQAIVFSALFNALLVLTFLWPGLLSGGLRLLLGVTLLAWWCAGVWLNRRFLVQWSQSSEMSNPELTTQLVAAQHQYLRGHWPEAESILRQILRQQPRDIEASLLLCQVWRRSGRLELAREQLGHLQNWDESLQWFMEISREIQALDFEMSDEEFEDAEAPLEELAEDEGTEQEQQTLVGESSASPMTAELDSNEAFSNHDPTVNKAA